MSRRTRTWTADNGNGTYSNLLFYEFSDPDMIRVGRDYYLTGTTMHAMPGLPILHSRDLVNWSLVTLGPHRTARMVRVSSGRTFAELCIPCISSTGTGDARSGGGEVLYVPFQDATFVPVTFNAGSYSDGLDGRQLERPASDN